MIACNYLYVVDASTDLWHNEFINCLRPPGAIAFLAVLVLAPSPRKTHSQWV